MSLAVAHEWHSHTSFNGVRLYFCVHCGRYIGPTAFQGDQNCVARADAMPAINGDEFIDEMNIGEYIRRRRPEQP